MSAGVFTSAAASHAHSLETLNLLYEYDDFMSSVRHMADIGCGLGHDTEWWATRTTRDEKPTPLDIKCTGIDLLPEFSIAKRYRNMQYLNQNFEEPLLHGKNRYDVIWCHDAFQYALKPLDTLRNWHTAMYNNGMLIIVVPQTTLLEYNREAFDQRDFVYYNWTLVSLIHALAVSGFDCREGFFKKAAGDPWLHAVVYKSAHAPMNPQTTRWTDLADRNLLPECVIASANRWGQVRQADLVLPWLTRALYSMGDH
jgi:SAM-dependent methyltransferase